VVKFLGFKTVTNICTLGETITKKNTRLGTWLKFVCGIRFKPRKTKTSEGFELVVIGLIVEKCE
jgi:hypothetical protein